MFLYSYECLINIIMKLGYVNLRRWNGLNQVTIAWEEIILHFKAFSFWADFINYVNRPMSNKESD